MLNACTQFQRFYQGCYVTRFSSVRMPDEDLAPGGLTYHFMKLSLPLLVSLQVAVG